MNTRRLDGTFSAAGGETVCSGRVLEGLRRVAAPFGEVSSEAIPLPFAELLRDAPRSYAALAVELVYEGYLLHYRSSRVLQGATAETRLLAGDHFYARGLGLVAQADDIAAVSLLARLMAACSCLRVQHLPFHLDDTLWEVTALAVGSNDVSCRECGARAHAVAADLIAAERAAELPEMLGPSVRELHSQGAHWRPSGVVA
jgi:hypothetical protein